MSVAALFAVSCVTDATEDMVQQVGGEQTTITLSLDESRTHIAGKHGEEYPLYWSAGDKIAINGVSSEALTEEAHGKTVASFVLNGEPTYPYNLTYPAPAEGVVAAEGKQAVTFLANQNYEAGTFAEGATPMYGYVEAEGDAVELHHLAGVLCFAPKGEATLTSMTISAQYGKIAGNFDLNCTDGTLVAHEDATNTITVSFGEGLALGAEATPIYVALPAGEYGDLLISLHTATDSMDVKFNSNGEKAVKAGVVRQFADFAYSANSDISKVFEIYDEASLRSFADMAADFFPRRVAKVTASIDMTGKEWTPIEGFGAYTFDGGKEEGFEIKGLTAPLFGTTSATIKNLKLTDVNIVETETPNVGAIARSIVGAPLSNLSNCAVSGSINVNCPNYVSVNNTDKEFATGGLVGCAVNVDVANCVNEASIEIVQVLKESEAYKTYPCIGGIVGYAPITNTTAEFNFVDCENKGNIAMNEVSDTTGDRYLTPRVGGIIGNLTKNYTSMNRCVNRGSVSLGAICAGAYLGGIAGHCGTPATDNCANHGTVTLSGKVHSLTAGGIVGHADGEQHFDTCENHGDIISTAEAEVGALLCGGITGTNTSGDAANGNRYISHCLNAGNITLSHTQPQDSHSGRYTVAGIVAWSQGKLDANVNSGTITINSAMYAASDCTKSHGIAGISAYKTVSAVSNNTNNGAIILNGSLKVEDAVLKAGKAVFCVGGILGYTTQTMSECYNENSSITVNGTYDAALYVGGMLGYGGKINNLTNNCSVTISSTAKLKGLLMGGAAGYASDNSTGASNSAAVTFEGNVDMTSFGDGTNTKGCSFFSIGGVLGRCGGNVKTCTNNATGTVSVGGKFTAALDGKYGYTTIGGTAGTLSSGAHSGLSNYATVNISSTIPNASWNEEPFTFAGVVGYVTNNLTDVTNYGALNVSSKCTSDEPLRISGVFGRGSNSAANKYTNIINKGKITISASSDDHLYVSGIATQNLKSIYSNVVNEGEIEVTSAAKSNNWVIVGGVFAWASGTGITAAGPVRNSGNITVKGVGSEVYVAGVNGKHCTTAMNTYVNTGDIAVERVAGSTYPIYVGGIAATATVNLENAKCYCSIRVDDDPNTYRGWITGAVRSETVIAKNCELGGKLLGAWDDEDQVYEETKLNSSNYYNYIYGGTTDWTGVTDYDGCTLLSAKPE